MLEIILLSENALASLQKFFDGKPVCFPLTDGRQCTLFLTRTEKNHVLVGRTSDLTGAEYIEKEMDNVAEKDKSIRLIIYDRQIEDLEDFEEDKDLQKASVEKYRYVAYDGDVEVKKILIDFLSVNVDEIEFKLLPTDK